MWRWANYRLFLAFAWVWADLIASAVAETKTESATAPSVATPKARPAKARYSTRLENGTQQIAVSPDGRWLALLSEGGEAALWNASTGRQQGASTPPFEQTTFHLGFRAADNTLLAFGMEQVPGFKTSSIASLRWHTPWPPDDALDLGDSCNHLLFDATGTFAVFLETRRLAATTCTTGQALWVRTNADGEFVKLALARDGQTLAATVSHNTSQVQILTAHTGQPICRVNEFSGEITALALSPEGRILATSTEEDGLALWELPSGKRMRQWACPTHEFVTNLAFSPNGHWLAVSFVPKDTGPCRTGLFRMPGGELMVEWKFSPHKIQRQPPMAFANDSKTLYIAGQKLTAWPLPETVSKH